MKVTNLKTKETYELSKDAAAKLAKSKLGNLFSFEKAAPTPPETLIPYPFSLKGEGPSGERSED